MVQQLKVVSEDYNFLPGTHIGSTQRPVYPASGDLLTSSFLCRSLYPYAYIPLPHI